MISSYNAVFSEILRTLWNPMKSHRIPCKPRNVDKSLQGMLRRRAQTLARKPSIEQIYAGPALQSPPPIHRRGRTVRASTTNNCTPCQHRHPMPKRIIGIIEFLVPKPGRIPNPKHMFRRSGFWGLGLVWIARSFDPVSNALLETSKVLSFDFIDAQICVFTHFYTFAKYVVFLPNMLKACITCYMLV